MWHTVSFFAPCLSFVFYQKKKPPSLCIFCLYIFFNLLGESAKSKKIKDEHCAYVFVCGFAALAF